MRKFKLFALLAGLLFSVGTVLADALPTSGSCGKSGDNLTWEITDHGIGETHDYWLTISGTGEMKNWSESYGRPWEAYKNEWLTKVIINEGVTTIGNYAFTDFTRINELTIPEGVTSIGKDAFERCTMVGSYGALVFPASIQSIGDRAFSDCYLQNVSFTTPSNLTSIGQAAFERGAELQTIVIPEGVTTIGKSAFGSCAKLISLSLPSTLTKLGKNFISGCTKIQTVEINAATPPTMVTATVSHLNENVKIKYPNGSDSLYVNKKDWIDFWDYLYNASTNAHAPVPHGNGNCGVDGGDNVTWEFTMVGSGNHIAGYEGTLTLKGSGEMDDSYSLSKHTPWFDIYTPLIRHIDIQEGITSISASAFVKTEKVNTYLLPSTLTYIGPDAFFACNNPEAEVYINADPDDLTWWDNAEGSTANPDDFLSWQPTPFGQADIFYVQATKCYVPLGYFKKYLMKWSKAGNPDKTNVNVFFAYGFNDYNDAAGINSALNTLDGTQAPVVTLTRPLNRDGYFATLCLPFDMSAEQIALSSLAQAQIKRFTGATISGGNINLEFALVNHIEAGVPYFVKFTGDVKGDALDRIDFMNVTIDKTAPTSISYNGVTMHGTYVPKEVTAQSSIYDGVFFLGPNNTFNWPSKSGNIKPFRAYFTIDGGGGGAGAPKRGMPVRIVERENAPTATDYIKSDEVQFNKTIENGMLIIEKNGVRYNAQGQIVK